MNGCTRFCVGVSATVPATQVPAPPSLTPRFTTLCLVTLESRYSRYLLHSRGLGGGQSRSGDDQKTSSCTDQQKQMSMPNASSCTDENLTAQASSRHPTLHLILRPDDHVPSTSRTGPSQLGPALLWFAGPRPFKKGGEYIFRPQSSRDNKSIQ